MIHEIENVCFCLARRHPNVFIGRRLPSNCRYCNAQFDLTSIMSKAEAEAKGLLKMPEEAAPKTPAEEPAAPPASVPTGFGAPKPSMPFSPPPHQAGFTAAAPAAPAGFGMGKPSTPVSPSPAPIGFGAAPIPSSPAPAGFGMDRPAAPAAPPPAPMGFGAQSSASSMGFSAAFAPQMPPRTPAAQVWQFDFFGEKIAVPQEGGWLGRSAIGSEWLKGNLLISREHVKVVPMPDGSLQIGPDKSLNGVSITANGTKRALGRNETAVLSAGDTLWLYNVPLQLEMK